MGQHLVQREYTEGAIKPGSQISYRGRMSRVDSIRDGVITFDNGLQWEPADGERYEVSEHEEEGQGAHSQETS